jgi:uncharacterized protein (DUF2147 family)
MHAALGRDQSARHKKAARRRLFQESRSDYFAASLAADAAAVAAAPAAAAEPAASEAEAAAAEASAAAGSAAGTTTTGAGVTTMGASSFLPQAARATAATIAAITSDLFIFRSLMN